MSQSYHNVRNTTGVNNISRRVCFLSFPTFILAYRGSCRFRAGKVHVLPTMSYVVTEEPFPEKRMLKFHGLFICFCTFLAKPFFLPGLRGTSESVGERLWFTPESVCVRACVCVHRQNEQRKRADAVESESKTFSLNILRLSEWRRRGPMRQCVPVTTADYPLRLPSLSCSLFSND